MTSNLQALAQECVGWKYLAHGRQPYAVDCYGLILHIFSGMGVDLPDFDYINDAEKCANVHNYFYERVERVFLPQEGDIVMMRSHDRLSHMGIYLGGGRMIHASIAGVGIVRTGAQPYCRMIEGYYRLK